MTWEERNKIISNDYTDVLVEYDADSISISPEPTRLTERIAEPVRC
ncbi:hypothetical protein [Anaerocolumna jejuensis]